MEGMEMAKAKFTSLDIGLTIVGSVIYGLGSFATMGIAIGFVVIRPAHALAALWSVLFGPMVGGLSCGLGNFISDVLAGWLGVGGIGGFTGTFVYGYLAGYFIKDPTDMKQVLWHTFWPHIPFALIVAGWIWWLGFAPFETLFITLMVDAVWVALFTPLLVKIFYPRVKARGMYWGDRVASETK